MKGNSTQSAEKVSSLNSAQCCILKIVLNKATETKETHTGFALKRLDLEK
jgi:hypothetical protein